MNVQNNCQKLKDQKFFFLKNIFFCVRRTYVDDKGDAFCKMFLRIIMSCGHKNQFMCFSQTIYFIISIIRLKRANRKKKIKEHIHMIMHSHFFLFISFCI